MTYQNPQMARGARQLKAVAAVVALFAVTLAGLTLTLAPHEARPEALLLATGVIAIAIFMWTYAARPGLFTGQEGVFDDPLRTSYSVPQRSAEPADDQAVGPEALEQTHAAARAVPVSEHIYRWQGSGQIAQGDRVWTGSYVRLLAKQAALVIGGTLAFGLSVAGVTLGLGESVGETWFVAAAIILPVGFALSHRSEVVDTRAYPTEPMAAMPDLTWTRAAAGAAKIDVAGDIEAGVAALPVATGQYAA